MKNLLTGMLIQQKKHPAEPIFLQEELQKTIRVMKATSLFLLLGICGASATTYAQTARLNVEAQGEQISEVLKDIEEQSEYTFVYNINELDLDRHVSISAKNASINEVLNQLFAGAKVKYVVTDRHIALYAVNPNEKAQQDKKIITGTIVDPNGIPVIGANIIEKGTTNGTVTDMDGKFSLSVTPGTTLQISYIGFNTQEVRVGSDTNYDIVLKEDAEALDELVVVGYGSQRKSDLTGGITAIGEEGLQMVSTNNLMDRLSGQVPGLNVQISNATPGEDQTLRVRGENSLTADNSPLIILDGIPYSGSLGDIDPNVIESMSVLKDASSAAIYGSRGANGVILIQTKKGRKGAAQVVYKGQVGMQQPQRRINVMKGPEYVKYIQDYYRLRYGYSGDQLDPMTILNPSERENYQNGVETDWQDMVFRNALTTNHQISISGGTDNTTYMASISHTREDGIVKDRGLKRTNISLNVTQVFNKWLTIGMSTQAIQKDYGGISADIGNALRLSPYGEPNDENGDINFYPMDQTLYYHPLADSDATADRMSRNVFISTFAEIQFPVEGLKFRTNFGYNYRNREIGEYYGRTTLTGQSTNGYAHIENQNYWDYTWENVLSYDRTFGKHKVGATALFSVQETNTFLNEQSGESFVNDDSEYFNMAGAEKNKILNSELTHTAMLSYMLRLNYAYDNRYLITLTGRSDGYSAFGANNKYAFFPSAAVAWNMSQESFMEDAQDWLDMLKIRLSYGSNGNQAINAYQTLDRLSLTTYIWGDNGTTVNGTYMKNNAVGNPNLRWETSHTFNAGVDFSFFGGRLSGNLDMYVVNTSDLLMSRTVPYMNGFKSIMDNVGKTRNKGVEFSISSVNVRNDSFQWGTTVNFALNRDEIVELRGDGKDDITNEWFIGEPIQAIYDYGVVGIWQEGDNFLTADGSEIQAGAEPGFAKIEDHNGDGKITSDDKYVLGSRLPSFTLSMSNRFDYKNFYFSFLLNGVFGQMQQLYDYQPERWGWGYNYISDMNYWTPENPDADVVSPAYNPYDKMEFYKKVNYVAIKNITLGYNFPKQMTSKIGIAGLGVNVSVNNAYTFSNVKNWLNLEAGSSYNMATAYPTARSYMFGLNVTF